MDFSKEYRLKEPELEHAYSFLVQVLLRIPSHEMLVVEEHGKGSLLSTFCPKSEAETKKFPFLPMMLFRFFILQKYYKQELVYLKGSSESYFYVKMSPHQRRMILAQEQ